MTTYKRPETTAGMRHLALNVNDLENTLDFYTRLMAMEIEWQPDEDNYYLTSGNDNLALHRGGKVEQGSAQSLDHLGFIIDSKDGVIDWFNFLQQEKIEMLTEVKDHRDGARSFYCKDPDGNVVQIIYHPPLSTGK
ncbi:MAG: glyoxalase [Thiotrichaceae bacterium]|nr:MAG: glyoxalase [Thiotrichaceae bacterium]